MPELEAIKTLTGGSTIGDIKTLSGGTICGVTGYDEYTGEYVVVPDIEPQELDTQNKLLKKNVSVASIPYYEVSNEANGETVIIGGL